MNVFVTSHTDTSENYFKGVYVVKVTDCFTQLLKVSKCKGSCLKSDYKEECRLQCINYFSHQMCLGC